MNDAEQHLPRPYEGLFDDCLRRLNLDVLRFTFSFPWNQEKR